MGHLIFTLDFHELVRGQLKKGEDNHINYDPLRLASGKEDYLHGSTDFEFTAHIQYKPGGGQEVKLVSEAGLVSEAIVRNDGRGSMLSGDFKIPSDAEEVIVWISMKDKNGNFTYDNDAGKNFHFRITSEDTKIGNVTVTNDKTKGYAVLKAKVDTIPSVQNVLIRYRITNGKKPLEEVPVSLHSVQSGDKIKWETEDIQIPFGSVVVYDLSYFVDDKKYKLDNNGNYYIAEVY